MSPATAEPTTILPFPRKLERPLPRQRTNRETFPENVVPLPGRRPRILLPQLTAETLILASVIWALPAEAKKRLRQVIALADTDDDQDEAAKTFIGRALSGQSI